MDSIELRGLPLLARIGAHDHERQRRQWLYLDLDLGVDVRRAAATDQLADALDYESVAGEVRALAELRHYDLIETLAEHCAQLLLKKFQLPWLRLRLHKPGALPGAAGVAVSIERRA